MRRQIVIELTSLLDVIMILLFLVIYNTTSSAADIENNNKEQMTQMSEQIEQLQKEVNDKTTIVESIEAIEGECTVITIRGYSDPYDPQNENDKNKLVFTVDKEPVFEAPLILEKNYIYNTIYDYLHRCYNMALQENNTIIYVIYDRAGASRHEPGAVEVAYNAVRQKNPNPSNMYYKEIISDK